MSAGEVRAYLAKIGAKGGKTSRRTLTPEQAKAMVTARERKRSERAAGAGRGAVNVRAWSGANSGNESNSPTPPLSAESSTRAEKP